MDSVWFRFVAILLIQNAILTTSLVFPDRQQNSNYPQANQNYYNPNHANIVAPPNVNYVPPKNHHNHGHHRHPSRKHDYSNRRLGPPGNQNHWNQHSQNYYPNYQSPYNSGYIQMPTLNCTETLRSRTCLELNIPCTMHSECCTWNCNGKKCRPSRSGSCTRDNECNTEICLKTLGICKCSCANFGRKCTDNDDCCFGVCNTTLESNSKLICVCKKMGETCITRNDCCGENWMCAKGICIANTKGAAPEETSKTNLETGTKADNGVNIQMGPEMKPKAIIKLGPETTTIIEPEIKIETKPNSINKLKTETTTIIGPAMKIEMKPKAINKLRPEMITKMEPEMKIETKPIAINTLRPDTTTIIEPAMKIEMKPKAINKLRPEMTTKMESDMTTKIETNTINKMEPGMTTIIN